MHQHANIVSDAVDQDPEQELWATLRYCFDWALQCIGAPRDLAHIVLLGPEGRAEILAWLAPLEALLRRLVFLSAHALAPPAAKAKAKTRAATPRAQIAFNPDTTSQRPKDPDQPESWRVSFRLLHARRADSRTRTRSEPRLTTGWALALRLEALRRAIANPAPLAQRMACLLRRRSNDAHAAPRSWTAPPQQRNGRRHYAASALERAGQLIVMRTAFADSS